MSRYWYKSTRYGDVTEPAYINDANSRMSVYNDVNGAYCKFDLPNDNFNAADCYDNIKVSLRHCVYSTTDFANSTAYSHTTIGIGPPLLSLGLGGISFGFSINAAGRDDFHMPAFTLEASSYK